MGEVMMQKSDGNTSNLECTFLGLENSPYIPLNFKPGTYDSYGMSPNRWYSSRIYQNTNGFTCNKVWAVLSFDFVVGLYLDKFDSVFSATDPRTGRIYDFKLTYNWAEININYLIRGTFTGGTMDAPTVIGVVTK